jgi:hypothetical protein
MPPIGDEPQPPILDLHPHAGVIMLHHYAATPLFTVERDLDGSADGVCVN